MYDWYRIFLIAHPIFTILATIVLLFWLILGGSLLLDLVFKSRNNP